jgi:hypothetical protein
VDCWSIDLPAAFAAAKLFPITNADDPTVADPLDLYDMRIGDLAASNYSNFGKAFFTATKKCN